MTRNATRTALLLALVGSLAWGCRSTLDTTSFVNPGFDFAFVEKVAVLPLENLSADRQAGVRATRLLITELLASGAVEVVEPGEVQAALDRIPGSGRTPSREQVIELGKALGAQAVISGSVNQSEVLRSGSITVPAVTLDVHMMEAETGAAVWAATHTERGATLGAKILGTGAEPISETTRRCVREILESLLS